MSFVLLAHKTQIIDKAENLLYIESPTSVISATKGTQEYDNLLSRLIEMENLAEID